MGGSTSIFALFGMGYAVTPVSPPFGLVVQPPGPGSLSLAYALKVMGTSGWVAGTILNGIP